MNQKSLIITIIAVVAVGVLVTLWLTGAVGSGPLSGCADCVLGPQLTTLTLEVWVYHENTGIEDERQIAFHGALNAGGNPVQGQTVTISSGGSTTATVTTGSTGFFDAIYNESGGSHTYVAIFAGDDQYQGSESNVVSSP